MSNNQEHLKWIYDRLILVHNENPNVDYMVRFRGIIDDTGAAEFQPTQITVSEATLERALIALEAGLEAATGEHSDAILQDGWRRPLRVKWYAEQVELIAAAINDLRRDTGWTSQ